MELLFSSSKRRDILRLTTERKKYHCFYTHNHERRRVASRRVGTDKSPNNPNKPVDFIIDVRSYSVCRLARSLSGWNRVFIVLGILGGVLRGADILREAVESERTTSDRAARFRIRTPEFLSRRAAPERLRELESARYICIVAVRL